MLTLKLQRHADEGMTTKIQAGHLKRFFINKPTTVIPNSIVNPVTETLKRFSRNDEQNKILSPVPIIENYRQLAFMSLH